MSNNSAESDNFLVETRTTYLNRLSRLEERVTAIERGNKRPVTTQGTSSVAKEVVTRVAIAAAIAFVTKSIAKLAHFNWTGIDP